MKPKPFSRSFRLICALLSFLHTLMSYPVGLLALTPNPQPLIQQSKQTPQTAEPDRTLPSSITKNSPDFWRFSTNPTDEEIYRAKVLREPLVPIGLSNEETRREENKALAETLQNFARRTNFEDASILTDFIERYPNSVWRAAILGNLGDFYYHTGYFSKALTAWEEAWQLSKAATDLKAKRMADWIVGELAEMNSRVGRFERLGPLLKEIENRELIGPGAELISRAKNGLWCMQNRPTQTFVCGTAALKQCADRAGLPFETQEKIMAEECSLHGFYLKQLYDIAQKNGLNYQIVKRDPGAAIPDSFLPLVIHWKVKHYGALLAQADGRFLMSDPIFDAVDQWMSPKAIDEESTGYCLVPSGPLPQGWHSVTEEEIADIWGKGKDTSPDANETKDNDDQACGKGPCGGMAIYTIHTLLASLHLEDMPVGYQPPVGSPIDFKIMYNQREAQNPANFTFSNFGPRWSFNWMTYVVDNPQVPQAPLKITCKGGANTYAYDANKGKHLPDIKDRSTVKKVSDNPLRYERLQPDGTLGVFERTDGTTVPGRKIFLTQIIDPQGNKTQIYYDEMNRISAIEDTIGQISTLSYESKADQYRITKITDPFGRSAIFNYNSAGLLEKITDVIGITSQFQYGPGDFVQALITPYGKTEFTTGQQGADRWVETLDPYGDRERVEYRSFKVKDPNPSFGIAIGGGNGWQYNPYINERNTFIWDKKAMKLGGPQDYTKARLIHWLNLNGHHNVISGLKESTKEPLEDRVGYRYPNQAAYNATEPDMIGKPKTIERTLDDGTVQKQTYAYNDLGRVTNSVDERARNFSYIYAPNQIDLLEIRQTKGQAKELLWKGTYNTQHRLLTSTGVDGQTTVYTYNPHGQVLTITNPKQEVTTYEYDSNGYLKKIYQQGILFSTLTYDNYGRVYTVTDSEGYTLTMNYDALDRLTKITYPNNKTQEWVYDKLDPVTMKDRMGRETHFHFNALRQLVALQDALGRTMNFEWCKCGSLQGFTDPQGKITKWKYDVQGRLVEKTYPDNSKVAYGYYTNISWLKLRTDAMNQKTQYTYYPDNRLASISYSDTKEPTPTVNLTYSLTYPRISSMTDGTGNTTYDYYPMTPPALGAGQLKEVNGSLTSDAITYSYDELGRVKERKINNVPTTYVYDNLDRLKTVANPLGTFTNTYWNNTGRLKQLDYPNGQKTILDYYNQKQDQRLKSIGNFNAKAEVLSQFNYTYDANGIISENLEQLGQTPLTKIKFNYDKIDQLISAQYDEGGKIVKESEYGYDKSGNRTLSRFNEQATQATYNELNQLISRNAGGELLFKGALNEAGEVSVNNQKALVEQGTNFTQKASLNVGTNIVSIVAKDDNNNSKTNLYQIAINPSEEETFEYDLNGNITKRVKDSLTTTYNWDGADRLIRIAIYNTQFTNTTEFVYDGLSRRVRITERVNNTITKDNRFVWEKKSLVEERNNTGFLTTKRYFNQGVQIGNQPYYYTKDHLGSIREMTDISGKIRARYDYDVYGKRTKLEGDLESDFGFTGYYHHQASGLSFALYRAYDPDLGRFINRDPIKELGGFNLYQYVENNPVNYIDPDGEMCQVVLAAAAGLVILGMILKMTESAWEKEDEGEDKKDEDPDEHVEPEPEEAKESREAQERGEEPMPEEIEY